MKKENPSQPTINKHNKNKIQKKIYNYKSNKALKINYEKKKSKDNQNKGKQYLNKKRGKLKRVYTNVN